MKVLKVDSPEIREQIEQWSIVEPSPNVIRFTQDGAGIWFITDRVVNNPIYAPIKDSLMLANGEWVDYTPVPDIE